MRWAHSVAQYHEQEKTLCGDVLLTAAFISYAGSFSKTYRRELLDNLWMPFLRNQKVKTHYSVGYKKKKNIFITYEVKSLKICYSNIFSVSL